MRKLSAATVGICAGLIGLVSCHVEPRHYIEGCPPGWVDDGFRCVPAGGEGGRAGSSSTMAGVPEPGGTAGAERGGSEPTGGTAPGGAGRGGAGPTDGGSASSSEGANPTAGASGGGSASGGGTETGGAAGSGSGGTGGTGGSADGGDAGLPGTGGAGAANGGDGGTAQGGVAGAAGDGDGGTAQGGAAGAAAASGGSGGGGTTSPHPTALAIGSVRICALISDGRVYCWGAGLLGNGGDSAAASATPVEVTGIADAIQITAGVATTCALLADHTIRCWGDDDFGQISADGTTSTGNLEPVPVGGLTSVSEVVSMNWNVCALLANGSVRCWGSSDGSGAGSAIAAKTMPSLTGATQLGGQFCAVLADGTVKCWTGASGTPTEQSGLPANITQVTNNCALSRDGSVRCWGPGGQGQIGNGLTDDQAEPQLVEQLGQTTWIGAGNHHVCAILADQSFSCWGKDGFFDPIDYGAYPLPIAGVGKVAAAAAGFDNTCVIETDHTVKCWGSNLSGYQLGENGPSGNSATPVVIAGLPSGG